MIEISLSFLAWLSVVFIQLMAHVKVIYLRRVRDSDEPPMIERDSAASSEVSWPETTEEDIRKTILSRTYSDPAMDDFDDDDEPPNLKQRLSMTGSEMMSSCKSLESMVQEQILAQ